MVLNQLDPTAMSDTDTSTTYTNTTATPPETIIDDADFLDTQDPLVTPNLTSPTSSIPWPGSTFIIRCLKSGNILTFRSGKILLDRPGGRGNIHWICIENDGWLGFRDSASGMYLGHDGAGRLVCKAERHRGYEYFCVRQRPEGGYVLLMTHWHKLWHLGSLRERGEEKLAKVENWEANGLVWEFVKV